MTGTDTTPETIHQIMISCQGAWDDYESVIIDTGSPISVIGKVTLERIRKRYDPGEITKTRGPEVQVKFGDGQTRKSIGMIRIPLTASAGRLYIDFYVTPGSAPAVVGVSDMKTGEMIIDPVREMILTPDWSIKLHQKNSHLVAPIESRCSIWWTDTEISRVHRQYGHPSEEKMQEISGGIGDLDGEVKKLINKVVGECEPCPRFTRALVRHKFRSVEDGLHFNREISLDIALL